MNTQRVKNMVIILLAVLNVVLFVALIIQSNTYRLTAQQEKAVRSLLSDNAITVSANITKTFKPIKALNMLPYTFDISKEADSFFDDTEKTAFTEAWNKTTIASDTETLSLEENVLRFESSVGYKNEDFLKKGYSDMTATRNLCDEYIEKIRPNELKFEFDHIEQDEDYSFYYYRGIYKGHIIYSNYIRLRVSALGVEVASCYYSGIPSGYNNYAREIYAPDEALFSLMKHLKNVYTDVDIDINDMEMVYYLDSIAIDIAKAVPCYRFKVSVKGINISYLVDGYTNNVIR